MKLSQCTIGQLVITENKRVVHVVGLTYNVAVSFTGNMSQEEKFDRTIPVIKFPEGEEGTHHANLTPFKG
jgi:hypothetical protein